MGLTRTHMAALVAWLGIWIPAELTAQVAPQPVSAAQPAGASQPAPVVIRPGDVLRITVWPDEKLGGDFQVEESGEVHLPGVGTVRAAGVTLDRLRITLRDAYARTIRQPVVTVTTVFKVPALGELARPGYYEVTPTQTVHDLVAMAGGFGQNADPSRVRLVRDGQSVELDARLVRAGTDAGLTPQLRPGDQLIVPRRSWIRSVNPRDVLIIAQSVALAATIVTKLAR